MHTISLNKLTATKGFLFEVRWIILIIATAMVALLIARSLNEPVDNSITPSQYLVQNLPNNNLKEISTWHLFGLSHTLLKKVRDNHIELIGIIVKGDQSLAIMKINSKEVILKTGDKIDNKYTIQRIENSRIIVKTKDDAEEIDLFGNVIKSTSPQVTTTSPPEVTTMMPNQTYAIPNNPPDQTTLNRSSPPNTQRPFHGRF
ncbi:MAG: type II secretion system protein N [Candidatus Berkiellales bacterium]